MARILGTNLPDIINGTPSDDTIFGLSGDDRLMGHDGNDEIHGGSGNDIVEGGAGDDVLFGGSGSNSLFGGAGSDILISGSGSDHMDGGTGIDAASWEASASAVAADLRTGRARSGGIEDTFSRVENLIGSRFNDLLNGDEDRNELFGGAGDDRLFGHGGGDTLSGGAGDDLLDGGAGINRLRGGAGTDTASYLSVAEASEGVFGVTASLRQGSALATDRHDVLAEIENLRGTNFRDELEGDRFANRIEGMGGDDRIDGGEGDDELVGGAGADTFVFRASNLNGKASDPFNSGFDRILDFSLAQGDRIDLRGHFAATDFATLRANASQIGTDTHLRLGADTIVLRNVLLSQLTPAMFVF